MELRDESSRWSHQSRFVVGHDECRDHYGREQCAAWRCAVNCRLDHVAHKSALDCAVSAMYSWGLRAWRMFCHVYSLWNNARLGVLTLEVLAILLDTQDVEVNLDGGCIKVTNVELNAVDVDVILKKSSKGTSESSGRNRDSEFV